MKTVGEAAVKTVAEAMVETRKSSRYHDSGPEPEKPRLGGPIRVIKRIGIIVRIRIAIGIFGRRGNHVDLRRQSRRSLGDPPAPIGLLAGTRRRPAAAVRLPLPGRCSWCRVAGRPTVARRWSRPLRPRAAARHTLGSASRA